MPTTEIAGFPIGPGININDPSGNTADRLNEWSAAIVEQKGYQNAGFGTSIENPNELVAVIAWDNIEAHILALRNPEYKVVTDHISTLFEGAGYMYHVDLEPHDAVEKVMAAPVMEIATFYFDDEPPEDFLENFHQLRMAAGKEQGGPLASAVGMTQEEIEHNDIKGNAVVLIAGWQSVDEHKAFRNSMTYKKYLPPLREAADALHVHHVSLRNVSKR